jgi:hypothetical protein
MTVKELREALGWLPEDCEVWMGVPNTLDPRGWRIDDVEVAPDPNPIIGQMVVLR